MGKIYSAPAALTATRRSATKFLYSRQRDSSSGCRKSDEGWTVATTLGANFEERTFRPVRQTVFPPRLHNRRVTHRLTSSAPSLVFRQKRFALRACTNDKQCNSPRPHAQLSGSMNLAASPVARIPQFSSASFVYKSQPTEHLYLLTRESRESARINRKEIDLRQLA